MCWNSTVSLQTFIFSSLPLILCLYFNLIELKQYIIYQTFFSMQLIEYFLWSNLKNNWNRFFSMIGFAIIVLLAAVAIYGGDSKYKLHVLGLYVVFICYILVAIPINFYTTVATNKHLSWNWLKVPFYIVVIWTLFFMYSSMYSLYSGNFKNLIMILFSSFIYIVTFYSYYKSNTFGTMWCWVANFTAIYFYYVLYMHLS